MPFSEIIVKFSAFAYFFIPQFRFLYIFVMQLLQQAFD